MSGLSQLCLFSGRATSTHAYLYARLPRPAYGSASYRLAGEVRGPFCRHAETLPATFQFVDAGPGPTILARAEVVDPCCWTPKTPMLYRATVKLYADDDELESAEMTTGIRCFGATGRCLAWEGKRAVIRGCSVEAVISATPRQWRDASAAQLIDEPDEAICRAAAEEGVLLVARFPRCDAEVIARLATVAHWPSLAVAVMELDEAQAQLVRGVAPNVLLATRAAEPTNWSDLVWWPVNGGVNRGTVAGWNCPVAAFRPLPHTASLDVARQAVDRLQRDLAPELDLAGYFV